MRLCRALLAALALLVICAQVQATSPDVAGALARLSAPSAGDRAAAERELARLLVIADAPLVAAAARSGSTEVRSRIASALTSDARHFALAAELAASADTDVARTGADALAGQAAEWLGTSDQAPLSALAFEREVRSAFSGMWDLDLSRGDLEDTLDQIARLVDCRRSDRPLAPLLSIVLDPLFDQRAAGHSLPLGPSVTGNFEDLLYAAAVTHGAVCDVYGWNEGRTWIVVRASEAAGGRSAQTMLQAWILAVARPSSPASARNAARALAASGWSAALEWLDARWRDQQDPAALDGLVLAAGRGALGSSLAARKGAEVLLERADRALENPEVQSSEAASTARALLTLGKLGSEAWAGGFARASARARGLRCALVAATRSCPADLATLLQARLLATDTAVEERCACLRALGALGEARGALLAIPNLEAAFDWAVKHGVARGFPSALRVIGAREPEAWKTARGLDPQAQSVLCADALAQDSAGANSVAGARIAALLQQVRGEESGLELLDQESLWLSAAQLRSGLLAARAEGADAATIARLLVCAGLDLPEEGRAISEEIFAKAEWSAADWRVAGARLAHSGGALESWPRKETIPDEQYAVFLARLELVRDRLLAATKPSKPALGTKDLEGMEAGWVQGCQRALRVLHARQSDLGAREFLRRLRVLFQRAQHPLMRELTARRFPPPSAAVLVDVGSREPWIGF